MTSWAIASKLQPSVRLRSPVPRTALMQRLDAALDTRLTVVHAPAGYGKSSLLAQWYERLRSQGIPVAWLCLDEHDSDPFQFLNYLIEACKEAGFAAGVDLINSPHSFSVASPAATSASLITALGRCAGTHAIVLDDYHRAECAETGALLDYLQYMLPGNVHLVISSRRFPRSLSTADLRAHEDLLELDQSELRFSPEEIAAYLAERAPSVGEWAQALFERTEGWPIALQAVRRWLQQGTPVAQALEQISGRASDLVDYFVEQVFDTLRPEEQALLLNTSILERVNGDLAEALCGAGHCWTLLERLEQRDLFVHGLDHERAWYRYHRLFSEFLQERLRRGGGRPVAELHGLAARWFHDHGHSTEAVQHALASGSAELLAEVLEALGGWHYALLGHVGVFQRALPQIPEVVLIRHPRLSLAAVYLDARLGEHEVARGKLEGLRAAVTELRRSDPELAAEMHLASCLIDRYAGREVTADELVALKAVTGMLPLDNHVMRAVSCNLQCAIYARLGRSEEAFAVGEQAIAHFRAIGSLYGETFIYFHQGHARLLQGRLRDAEALYREGYDLSVEHFGEDSDLAAIARAFLSEVAYEKNHVHEAERLLEQALPHIEQFDSWPEVYEAAYFTAMRLARLRQDADGLAAIARRVRVTARARKLPDLQRIMDARLRALWDDAESVTEGFDEGGATGADVVDPSLREARTAARARMLMSAGELEAAEVLLTRETDQAYRERHLRCFILLSVQLAIVQWQLDRHAEARATLEKALATSVFEGIKRPFIDAGPLLLPVLRDLTRLSEGRRRNRLRDTFLAELSLEIGRQQRNDQPPGLLSPREREVLGYLMQGRSNREIAEAVPLSINTVKFHIKNLFDKLAVTSRQDAVTAAIRRGLL